MDQTYFLKNKELLIITKNADTLLYNSVLWNSVQNFKANRQAAYFTSSSPSEFSRNASFNFALFIEGKTHVILYLLANSNIHRKTPVLQSLSSKVAGVLKDFTKFTIPYPDKFLIDCICILVFPCYILPPYPRIFFCGVLNFFFVLCS